MEAANQFAAELFSFRDSEDKSTENAPEELCNFPVHVRLGGLAREEAIALDELIYSSLVAMAKMVRARKISPVELAEAHLKRIKRLNRKLNAIVSMSAARVRAQA